MKKSYTKGFAPLVVIIIIVALAAGGVLSYFSFVKKSPETILREDVPTQVSDQQDNQIPTSSSAPAPTTTPQSIITTKKDCGLSDDCFSDSVKICQPAYATIKDARPFYIERVDGYDNKKSRKRGFAPLAVIIIIVALAAAVGVLVYQENVGINPVQEITPVSTNTISQTQEGSISSFAIVPSTKEGQSWTMYKKGAKAILKAKNITSAELWYTPTGTEIKSTFGGTMSKVGVDTWELELPANLLTTSFWAEATNLTGKKIKSVNLGNVW